MTELQRLAASLVALLILFPVVVFAAVAIGVSDADAIWLALFSWAGGSLWADWRRGSRGHPL
jgi:hypothetical protein